MQWNISFDICALIFLSLFCSYTFTMKRFKSRLNRIYDRMCVVVLCTVVLDLFSVAAVVHVDVLSHYTAYAGRMLYMLTSNSLAVGLYWYTMELAGAKRRFWLKMLDMIPYLAVMFLVLSTPWLKLPFAIDENNQFVYNRHAPILYLLSGYYILFSMVYIMRYRKRVSRQSRVSFLFFYLILAVALVLQALRPQLLLTGMACVSGLIAIYLAQLNPNVGIDSITNVFNKDAFYMSVSGHISDGKNFSVIAFEPDEMDVFEEKYGDVTTREVIKKIAGFLTELVNAQAVYRLGERRFAILLGSKDHSVPEETITRYFYAPHVFTGNPSGSGSDEDRIVLQALLERFDQPWVVDEERYELSVSICFLTYPEDATRADEVNDMVDASLRQAIKIGNGTVIYASEYVKTRENYINELQEKQTELEEMSRRAEQARITAEQADNTKSRFIAKLSHEIRTPVNAIVDITGLILQDDINEQVRRNAKSIQSAGNTLLAMFNDILDFSGAEAGNLKVTPQEYETALLLNSVQEIATTKLHETNLRLIVDIDPTLPVRLIGDELRLRQIIANLISNAFSFTEQGSVTIRIGWTPVENEGGKKCALLKVSVTDTGCGIREEDKDRLFVSYVRFGEHRNQREEGSGLGLSICKLLLERMGSEIVVESEYGKGSTFSFALSQEIADETPVVFVEAADQMCALVYAELPGMCERLSEILGRLGVECQTATSGYELELALEKREFTHVFIEYTKLSNVKELLDMTGKANVILVLRSRQQLNSGDTMPAVQKPFSCMNVAEVLCRKGQ